MAHQAPSAFIRNDGYFERGFVRGIPGLFPDLRFTFRPLPLPVYGRMQTMIARAGDDQAKSYDIQADTIIKGNFLVEWDIKDARGSVLEITKENFLGLKVRAFVDIASIIFGTGASDVDDNPPHMEGKATDEAVAFILGGEEAAQGAREKNSSAG